MSPGARPAPLFAVLGVTFLGSVSGGAFWAGLFFVAAQHYGFSPVRNLVLAAVMGGSYALAAARAGALLRKLGSRISARAVLISTLAIWALAGLLPLVNPRAEALLWAAALCGSATSAVLWPVVESFVAGGRHGAGMRAAIGWFNVTWTPAVAVPLLVMPLLARKDVLLTFALAAAADAAAVLFALALPPRPGAHEPELAAASLGREYSWLRRSALLLLPMSYIMSATLAPVLPHRLHAVNASGVPESVVAATWMLARFSVLFLMWRFSFWHGRWGTLGAAVAALVSGVALVLLAPSLPWMVLGLALFGTAMALIYYSGLYYSLAVGHAAVEASGSFEALIGLGYCVGPMIGVSAHAAAGSARAPLVTVILAVMVSAAVSGAALRPYLEARRKRS